MLIFEGHVQFIKNKCCLRYGLVSYDIEEGVIVEYNGGRCDLCLIDVQASLLTQLCDGL